MSMVSKGWDYAVIVRSTKRGCWWRSCVHAGAVMHRFDVGRAEEARSRHHWPCGRQRQYRHARITRCFGDLLDADDGDFADYDDDAQPSRSRRTSRGSIRVRGMPGEFIGRPCSSTPAHTRSTASTHYPATAWVNYAADGRRRLGPDRRALKCVAGRGRLSRHLAAEHLLRYPRRDAALSARGQRPISALCAGEVELIVQGDVRIAPNRARSSMCHLHAAAHWIDELSVAEG